MKIILATPLYPPETESLAVYTKKLAQRLQENHQVTVVAYADQVEKISGLKLLKANKHQPLLVRILTYTLLLWRAAAEADIIYAQNAVASGLPAILVKYLRRLPVLINFSEDEAWKRAIYFGQSTKTLDEFLNAPQGKLKIRLILGLQGWVLRRASAVVVSSQALAKLVTSAYHVPAKKIVVIYPPPEKTPLLPWETDTVPQQILTSGRWLENDIASLIRAISIVRNDFPEVGLIITGDGPAKAKLAKLVIELNLDKNIKFFGQVSKAEDWQLRLSSEIYLHPGSGQDFSPVIWQSFSADLPVIARANDINQELLGDEQRGILIKSSDEKEWAEKIILLFTDHALRHNISKNIQDFLGLEFSWDRHLKKLETMLKSFKN